MNNILKEIRTEDIVIYKEYSYSENTLKKSIDIFNTNLERGEVEGNFHDNKWMYYSDIKRCGVSFEFNRTKYKASIGKEFGISYNMMIDMLKCFAIYCHGVYIQTTIASQKIGVICRFLEKYKEVNFKLKQDELNTIEEFLIFINTPLHQIEKVIMSIRIKQNKKSNQRQLRPIINYLVVENEINSLYSGHLDDETFKKWFPIYFWTNITFILPLRATEMLVTPKNCITRKNDKLFLTVRRTVLKKKRRTVHYNVKRDYKEFQYEIPDMIVARNIEKYLELTSRQERRFLFEYSDQMINEMVSLAALNSLLKNFFEEHIIKNSKYDFAKYASGIKKFEYVTAGDSRPIAMANIYFQNFGEDVCRQLADHTSINTSSGYYSNISETIMSSSILQYHKKLNSQSDDLDTQYAKSELLVTSFDKSICTSKRREIDFEDLTDCIDEEHLEDCMGCKFYIPSRQELDPFLNKQKIIADKSAKRAIEFMNNIISTKNRSTTLEEIFLSVQTKVTRYRMGCNIKVKEKWKEWENHKNTQKTNF